MVVIGTQEKIGMVFLKLRIIAGLIIAMNMGLIVYGINSIEYQKLPKKVITTKYYAIEVTVNMQNLTFDAVISTEINIEIKTKTIKIQVANLIINKISITDHQYFQVYEPDTVSQRYNLGIIVLHFRFALIPGIYNLNMHTSGSLHADVKESNHLNVGSKVLTK